MHEPDHTPDHRALRGTLSADAIEVFHFLAQRAAPASSGELRARLGDPDARRAVRFRRATDELVRSGLARVRGAIGLWELTPPGRRFARDLNRPSVDQRDLARRLAEFVEQARRAESSVPHALPGAA